MGSCDGAIGPSSTRDCAQAGSASPAVHIVLARGVAQLPRPDIPVCLAGQSRAAHWPHRLTPQAILVCLVGQPELLVGQPQNVRGGSASVACAILGTPAVQIAWARWPDPPLQRPERGWPAEGCSWAGGRTGRRPRPSAFGAHTDRVTPVDKSRASAESLGQAHGSARVFIFFIFLSAKRRRAVR